MKAADLYQHLDLILERIETWPEPWAQDLADFLERKIEIAAERAAQVGQDRRMLSEQLRRSVRLDALKVLEERPGIPSYQAIQIVRKHTHASVKIIREEIAPLYAKGEHYGSVTHLQTLYASSMTTTSIST